MKGTDRHESYNISQILLANYQKDACLGNLQNKSIVNYRFANKY
ncbi:hypothetical protein Lbys_3278 [Leadbetterella byssophila DSM 17132]|uniref:Uncharacterized protein n=1 Tax=Leadbetterella byssophila (strain DSM 17132 / JCM 16389 / KACC 11308 / NBRC 106382 / 4M15) TaxID=649349 RepID=E4RWJ8_LEAB4|nr:hypothetical protein Lbys_3278 [Leadbetterella byssophila DSM 17132]